MNKSLELDDIVTKKRKDENTLSVSSLKPKNEFNPEEVEKNIRKKVVAKKEITTIRVSKDINCKLNALTSALRKETNCDTVELIIESYVKNLNEEEKTFYEMSLKLQERNG